MASTTNPKKNLEVEAYAQSAFTSGGSTTPMKILSSAVFHRFYKMFNAMGMGLFWESEELKLGDQLSGELEAVSLHIPQSWLCLADLAFMFRSCTTIVSIIYYVKSEGVRYAKGVSADAFHWNEKKGRYTPEKLQEWKNVLYDQSYDMDHIFNIKEYEDRKNIVYGVLKVIRKVPSLVEAPKDFELTTLQSERSHQQIIRIWGMGGSGKIICVKKCSVIEEIWEGKLQINNHLIVFGVKSKILKYLMDNSAMLLEKLPYDVFINQQGLHVKHTLATTLYRIFDGMK